MTTRERSLVFIAVIGLLVVGGGLLGYQLVLSPINRMDKQIALAHDGIDKDTKALNDLTDAMPQLKLYRKLSLPKNVDLAQREYETDLGRSLRESGFPVDRIGITPKREPELKKKPGARKPSFQKLDFDVEGPADLMSVVTFLDKFYRKPLLHRIKSIRLVKPPTVTGRQRTNELDVKISIEALILEGAEDRKTLFAADVEAPKRLARTSEQYVSIAGKDIFFGLPPKIESKSEAVVEKPRNDLDLTEFIVLDEITHASDGPTASLYDAYNNRRYTIRGRDDGSFRIDSYMYIKDRKRRFDFGKELTLKDDNDEVMGVFNILRIDFTEIYVEAEDKYYSLHIGGAFNEIKELSKKQVQDLKLPVKEKKPVKEEDDEPEEDMKKSPKDAKPALDKAKEEKPAGDDSKSKSSSTPKEAAPAPAKKNDKDEGK